jgi:hypothetical protein
LHAGSVRCKNHAVASHSKQSKQIRRSKQGVRIVSLHASRLTGCYKVTWTGYSCGLQEMQPSSADTVSTVRHKRYTRYTETEAQS